VAVIQEGRQAVAGKSIRWYAINRSDVVIGDIILGNYWKGDTNPIDFWEEPYTVTKIYPGDPNAQAPSSASRTRFDLKYSQGELKSYGAREFLIVGADQHDVLTKGIFQPKVIPEFPGKCTRCGRAAYVSAFSVTHQNEAAAKDCPARRA
jgi:hypothetical protein